MPVELGLIDKQIKSRIPMENLELATRASVKRGCSKSSQELGGYSRRLD